MKALCSLLRVLCVAGMAGAAVTSMAQAPNSSPQSPPATAPAPAAPAAASPADAAPQVPQPAASAPQDREAAVQAIKERANAYYAAALKSDIVGQAQYMAPESRQFASSMIYSGLMGAEIKDVQLAPSGDAAVVTSTHKQALHGSYIDLDVKYDWKLIDGQWYLVPPNVRDLDTPWGKMHFGGSSTPVDPAQMQKIMDKSARDVDPDQYLKALDRAVRQQEQERAAAEKARQAAIAAQQAASAQTPAKGKKKDKKARKSDQKPADAGQKPAASPYQKPVDR